MLPPPLNYSLNLELLLSLAFPLGPSLLVPPLWFLILGSSSFVVPPPSWSLLPGGPSSVVPPWCLLRGPSFLDPPSWISSVDPTSWTLLHGPSFVDPPPSYTRCGKHNKKRTL
ncbi:hypothetical protein F4604DRAFT_1933748 [Suillus subluteus]|nr:hypothetical protein F4604DRAFT_1933748 [Suillus subluteus]